MILKKQPDCPSWVDYNTVMEEIVELRARVRELERAECTVKIPVMNEDGSPWDDFDDGLFPRWLPVWKDVPVREVLGWIEDCLDIELCIVKGTDQEGAFEK